MATPDFSSLSDKFSSLGDGIGNFFHGIGNYLGTNGVDPLGTIGRWGDLLSGKPFFEVYDKPFTAILGGSSAEQSKLESDRQLQDVVSLAQDITAQNNANQEARDEANRTFNQNSANTAMQFEALEAQKNRDWQTEMSNTAYQRAVADMKKAGLSPLLFYANGGAGASTPAGGAASGKQATFSGTPVDTDTVRNLVGSYLTTARAVQTTTMDSITRIISTLLLTGKLGGSGTKMSIGFR